MDGGDRVARLECRRSGSPARVLRDRAPVPPPGPRDQCDVANRTGTPGAGTERPPGAVPTVDRAWTLRGVVIVTVVIAAVVAAHLAGVWDNVRRENGTAITRAIDDYGTAGPVIYIAAYALGVVLFVPGLPMTLVGGVAFGPLLGAVYVWIGATIRATCAFLVARYGLRDSVERWVAGTPRLARIDAAVARDGWRIVAITRLVPLFPFNVQNYAYGLTRIRFAVYVVASAICITPATVAYTFAAGAVFRDGYDVYRTSLYLSVAAALILLLSFAPRYIRRRSVAAGDLFVPMAIMSAVLA